MYMAQRKGQITPRYNSLIETKNVYIWIIYCKFQPLVFNTFRENDFSKLCMETKIWPCHKNGQPRIFIRSHLVDPNVISKDSASMLSWFWREKDCFNRIWAWWISCITMEPLNKVTVSLQQKAPCEIWWNLAKQFQRGRRLKITGFYTCI